MVNNVSTFRNMVYSAVFAAAMCVIAPFSVAIGPVPLSFATFAVYLTAGALGWRYGALSVALYIALGAVGLPVFSAFEGGFHKIAGVTGGYIVGYIPCAMAVGLAAGRQRHKALAYAAGMAAGTALLYACGTAWFMLATGNALIPSLALCVIPFLPGDAAKIAAACIAAPKLRSALSKTSRPY